LSQHRICDVGYLDIRRDPITVVRRIYEHFGWSLSRATEELMRRTLASQPRDRHKLHRYDLAQFGVDESESAVRFAAYCDRFGLAAGAGYTASEQAQNLVST
jgi:hypothetical protein